MQGATDRTWSSGYNTQIEYTTDCYRELSPSHLRFALLSRSVRPPRIDRPYTYLELGCGQGTTTCVLAAANPRGRFIGVDFMPAHIVHAKLLAEDAALDNVAFYDDSFAEFLLRDLTDFDFIVLHGVLSWVSPPIQQDIVKILRTRMKPGGVAYVSYNALPGWATFAPIRWFMRAKTERMSGGLDRAIADTLGLLEKMEQGGARYFRQHPHLKEELAKLGARSPSYLSHEYLNEDWNLFYFPEVAEMMSQAKLRFSASATLADNIDSISFPPGLRELQKEMGDPVLTEVLKDFATSRRFRRDIYVRGRTSLGRPELRDALERTTFALFVPRDECTPEVRVPSGKLDLVAEQHGRVLDVLADAPNTILGLKSDPRLAAFPVNELFQLVAVLCAVGYVSACCPPAEGEDTSPAAAAFNSAVLRRAVRGEPLGWLASPTLGGPVPVSMIEQLLLAAEASPNSDPIGTICRGLGGTLVVPLGGGQAIGGAELATHMRGVQASFRDGTLPRFRSLGIA